MSQVLALAAAVGAGLVGGVFFAFSRFVMRALGQLRPAEGIAALIPAVFAPTPGTIAATALY